MHASYEIRENAALIAAADVDVHIIALRAAFEFSQRWPRLNVATMLVAQNIEYANEAIDQMDRAFATLNEFEGKYSNV